ncbi:MAG: LPP20 family lipoprotein [Nitrospirota bacterium]|nr:LPP20 family lipoprotein [Nitrospirota bacterium]
MLAKSMSLTVLMGVGLLMAVSDGCGWSRSNAPSWIQGASPEYPAERYLTGVGQAESTTVAGERAYGAVAKIFKAEITAQSQDWESYLVLEKRGQTNTERHLTLDQITKVSTDKVIENVKVLDTWVDPKTGQHYALAGMDRGQAGAALLEHMNELDQAVETELTEAHQTQDKLAKVRNLRRAAKNLVLREAYNADLRVIRASGQGNPPAHRVADLTSELEQFMAEHLLVAVEVSGDQAGVTRRAVTEGLLREGLPVISQNGGGTSPELLVKGAVQLWDVSIPDPRFRYARWCSDFVITEVATQRIVGAVSLGGREGHLTPSEAMSRAVRVMQQELTSHLAKTLAGYVYGDTVPPTELPPAACPAKEHVIR